MLTHEQVKTHWWRVALVVAAVGVAAFARHDPFAGLSGLVPILVWCGGPVRSRRTGIVVGVVLLVLLAWFVVPRELGLAGPWVPAAIEVYWLHTTLAVAVCAIGGRRPSGRHVALVVAGFVVTGGVLFSEWETPPGDEGVSPGPAQLRVTESTACGSGGCWRELEATGDRAPEVMAEYLLARNFTPVTSHPTIGDPQFCRTTGLVVTHRLCAGIVPLTANSVRVMVIVV
ncbi:hypothetical protein [Amycolatopsis sp. NPDC051128]|uniref:hypothetical protein n=1 Tax=Amycolatopsis sp. NPDC051128 TaxID=3155412 RepID=UPI003441E307